MANQYANSKNQIDMLKQLYNEGFESDGDRLMREFINDCAKSKGLPEMPAPKGDNYLKDLIWNRNPLLKLVADKPSGAYVPVPIKVK